MNTLQRVALKQESKTRIKGNLWILFVVSLIFWGIKVLLDTDKGLAFDAGLSGFFTSFFVPKRFLGLVDMFLITPPLLLGMTYLYLDVQEGKPAKVGTLFDGFSDFGRVVLCNLLLTVYMFLWTLLLVVPGMIKMLSYSQTYFLLAEHPGMKAGEAITESRRLMQGHKWEFFVLLLSFIPWGLLFCVTAGIAGIYTIPYFRTTLAGYYRNLVDARENG